MDEQTPERRPPGRPRKNTMPKIEAKAEPKAALKFKAKPNWEDVDPNQEQGIDRFALPKWFLEKYSKDWSFQWVTNSVMGQEEPQHRGIFEKVGWTPVHQEDFEGELNGLFMKKNASGEINVGGQVLMYRPAKLTEKARSYEKRAALEQVLIKEQAWRSGDLPVSLDSQHPSAVGTNKINKSYERLEVPDK